jgi:hypothetical protein
MKKGMRIDEVKKIIKKVFITLADIIISLSIWMIIIYGVACLLFPAFPD